MQAIQRGYELLGRYLGMFHEKIDISADNAVILMRGRKYDLGITDQDGEEEEQESQEKDGSAETEPN